MKPHGVDRPVEFIEVKVTEEGALFIVEMLFVDNADAMLLKEAEDLDDGLVVLAAVLLVESVDGFEGALEGVGGFLIQRRLGKQTGYRCHTDAEELVEIVRINSQKRQPLEQWHTLLLRLLQDTVVEIHPANVAFDVESVLQFSYRYFGNLFFRFLFVHNRYNSVSSAVQF